MFENLKSFKCKYLTELKESTHLNWKSLSGRYDIEDLRLNQSKVAILLDQPQGDFQSDASKKLADAEFLLEPWQSYRNNCIFIYSCKNSSENVIFF